MNVVAAGVHHADFLSGVVFRAHLARVRRAGFFPHRQAVQIGPDHDRRAVAVFHHPDDAIADRVRFLVFADVLGHFAAGGFEFLRHDPGRAFFLGRELGVSVQILVDREQGRQLRVRHFLRRLRGRGSVARRRERAGKERSSEISSRRVDRNSRPATRRFASPPACGSFPTRDGPPALSRLPLRHQRRHDRRRALRPRGGTGNAQERARQIVVRRNPLRFRTPNPAGHQRNEISRPRTRACPRAALGGNSRIDRRERAFRFR